MLISQFKEQLCIIKRKKDSGNMGQNIYIAKQPILNGDGEIFAYELLYRDSEISSNIKSRKQATASVLSSTLNKFGINKLLGEHKAFVKADEEFILNNVVSSIPKEYFIFALQLDGEVSKKINKRIELLHSEGYMFAINDCLFDAEIIKNYETILKYISYIKVDVNTPAKNLEAVRDLDLEIIATKVEDIDKEQLAKDMGADYLQGYFFCKPKVEKQEKFDSEVENLVRLSNKLMQDCSIDELVEEFEKSPIVTIQLLKYANSGLFQFRQKLSSIKQIITLVGKTKLTQWLMLIIYATPKGEVNSNPLLFDRVRSRTYLMQEIARHVDKEIVSNAYFVGVISLMDTLFSVSKRTLMHELHVDKDIKDAILRKEGVLGEMYSFVLALEEFNTVEIEEYIVKHNISEERLEELTLNASRDLRDL